MAFHSSSSNRIIVGGWMIPLLLLLSSSSRSFLETTEAASFITVTPRIKKPQETRLTPPSTPPFGLSSFSSSTSTIFRQEQLLYSSTIDDDDDDDDLLECPLDESEASGACLEHRGYVADTKSPFLTVAQVYVAPIESLRDSHPSFHNENDHDDESSNVIKFSKKRESAKHSIHHPLYGNSTIGTTSTTTAVIPDDDDHKGPTEKKEAINSHASNLEYNSLVSEDELVLVDAIRKPGMQSLSRAFHRAGPRKLLHFDPTTVNAAIVTCGGLCPGLNNVIRELVHSLTYLYGAPTVWGVRGGFHGFHREHQTDGGPYQPIVLTNALVENIHHEGGTVLRSSRGGFDMDEILFFLQSKNISHLYIIGGDGTHRGAYAIHQECRARGLNVAVAGIPKTIDNDVGYIDRSFGFLSAVEAAQASIRSAKTEAMCFPNGVGIIKLMGRSAGFLAAFAALGSGDADAVLVPEVPIVLDGPTGLLPFLKRRIQEQNYAVVVVAEGAGEELFEDMTYDGPTTTAAGKQKTLPPIGEFIKDKVEEYFHQYNEQVSIKYIDPSYTVRSVPANAADTMYCMSMAQNAVHGAMAGFTGFSVGLVNNAAVYLPIPQLVDSSPRTMDPHGKTWEQILAMTGQPNTVDEKPAKPDQEEEEVEPVEPEFPSLPEPSIH